MRGSSRARRASEGFTFDNGLPSLARRASCGTTPQSQVVRPLAPCGSSGRNDCDRVAKTSESAELSRDSATSKRSADADARSNLARRIRTQSESGANTRQSCRSEDGWSTNVEGCCRARGEQNTRGSREELDWFEYRHFGNRCRRGSLLQRDHAPDTTALIIGTGSVGRPLIAGRLGDRERLFRVVMAATRTATCHRSERFGGIDRPQRVMLQPMHRCVKARHAKLSQRQDQNTDAKHGGRHRTHQQRKQAPTGTSTQRGRMLLEENCDHNDFHKESGEMPNGRCVTTGPHFERISAPRQSCGTLCGVSG